MRGLVHIVDDEDSIRESLEMLLRMSGYEVMAYSSGTSFLDSLDTIEPGCVLLDIHMPDISGLEVQQAMQRRGCRLPVVIMTGKGDIGMAVRAMKNGACDFIEKPYSNELLISSVEDALGSLHKSAHERERVQTAVARIATLSPRELEVLQGLLSARPNKLIAYELGISIRTVEVHRAKIMEKLGVRGLSAAVRMALAAGVEPLDERKEALAAERAEP